MSETLVTESVPAFWLARSETRALAHAVPDVAAAVSLTLESVPHDVAANSATNVIIIPIFFMVRNKLFMICRLNDYLFFVDFFYRCKVTFFLKYSEKNVFLHPIFNGIAIEIEYNEINNNILN